MMHKVKERVRDKRVLALINRYLKASIEIEGRVERRRQGHPRVGRCPLLANLLLDELDKELEKRGHRYVRYADDCAPRRREGGFM